LSGVTRLALAKGDAAIQKSNTTKQTPAAVRLGSTSVARTLERFNHDEACPTAATLYHEVAILWGAQDRAAQASQGGVAFTVSRRDGARIGRSNTLLYEHNSQGVTDWCPCGGTYTRWSIRRISDDCVHCNYGPDKSKQPGRR
jgi:hypothetical protein